MSRWLLPGITAAIVATFVAIMGATITELGPWYHALHQPSWAPPDAAYGVAWTVIFALVALAAASSWLGARTRRDREWFVGLFALNGFLNLLWSLLFFRLHRPDWALGEGVLLWLSVLSLVVFAGSAARPARLMLLPYLAWVSFALLLNFAIVRLNGPFG